MVRAPSALTSGSMPLKRRAWSFDASCLASASCSVLSSEMPSSVARRSAGQVVEEFWIATLTSGGVRETPAVSVEATRPRSEEHTSELQSRFDLVCRLLLETHDAIFAGTSVVVTLCSG